MSLLESYKQKSQIVINNLKESIVSIVGFDFNLRSPKQVGEVLFEKLGLPPSKKTKTGYSTDESVLNSLFDQHPVIPLMIDFREAFKLHSTYIEPLLELGLKDSENRVFSSFLHTGTTTGRLSSKNPNLQNIPVGAFSDMSLKLGVVWLIFGLILLIVSSRILVWGAVGVAVEFGISDLIIGLTIVALGTSLPELAASVIAARKGEHDIAIGNVVGSNMFNLLAVIGIAVVIAPMNNIPLEVLQRDWIIMLLLTIALFVMSYGFKGRDGRINKVEGTILILCYIAYNTYLGMSLVNS